MISMLIVIFAIVKLKVRFLVFEMTDPYLKANLHKGKLQRLVRAIVSEPQKTHSPFVRTIVCERGEIRTFWRHRMNKSHVFKTDMAEKHRFAFLLALRQRAKLKDQEKGQRKHKFWIRQTYRERKEKGEFHQLVLEMKLFDHQLFFRYFRMLPTKFEELLNFVGP